jgi:hypothetical protein
MRNGGTGGISNHGAGDRAHGAKHHRARQGAQGGIAAARLGPALCRRERQGDGRCEEKSFHLGFPPNNLMEHVTPQLRPNQGKIRLPGGLGLGPHGRLAVEPVFAKTAGHVWSMMTSLRFVISLYFLFEHDLFWKTGAHFFRIML